MLPYQAPEGLWKVSWSGERWAGRGASVRGMRESLPAQAVREDTATLRGGSVPGLQPLGIRKTEKRSLPAPTQSRSRGLKGAWVWTEGTVEKNREVALAALFWIMTVKLKNMGPTVQIGGFLSYF